MRHEAAAAASTHAGGGGGSGGGDDDAAVAAGPVVVDGVAVVALETRDGALHALRPSFVVLYEPDQAFIREVEVYKAERPGAPCRVYLLQHDTSTDEQRFLAALRREQEAFQTLIRARQHMAAPQEQDGRALAAAVAAGADARALAGPLLPPAPGAPPAAAVSTRKAGGRAPAAAAAAQVVVVDIREFMSPLPCVLHGAGFALAPLTLEVGDYILSPELCVERKSVPDLVGSLASGRLYHQAEAMCRHYATPVLLIEFDVDKHFGLATAPGDLGDDVSPKALGSKLALLLLHFPRLRVLWSRSVHATASLFGALKSAAEQPDPAHAAGVGLLTGTDEAREEPTNSAAIDFLRRLPGITERNAHAVLRQCGSLAALATASEARLAEVLGDAHQAASLHRFLHSPFPVFLG
jgi:DNA excision repair protein ERCC-4